jgi:hypothetical protein
MHALEQTGYADDTVVSFWGDREFSDGCIFSDRASDINAYSVELTHVWCDASFPFLPTLFNICQSLSVCSLHRAIANEEHGCVGEHGEWCKHTNCKRTPARTCATSSLWDFEV